MSELVIDRKDWQASTKDDSEWSCRQVTNLGNLFFDVLLTGTDNIAVVIPDMQNSWRGRQILSEEDAANIEFPYPPEPEWENDLGMDG